MNSQTILTHYDSGQFWPHVPSDATDFDVAATYRSSLVVQGPRIALGEIPRGRLEGRGTVSLINTSQPRFEPCTTF